MKNMIGLPPGVTTTSSGVNERPRVAPTYSAMASRSSSNPAAGLAVYREAELLRLQGDLDGAEEAYRAASRAGWEPQPGLAQLRLAQGRVGAAAAAIRRAAAENADPLRRAALLPAYVEIMLAAGETDEARTRCIELETVAQQYSSAMLDAIAAYERGAVELADGDAPRALESLRRALDAWRALEAPYEVARTRVLIAESCRMLLARHQPGDRDKAMALLDKALTTARELGMHALEGRITLYIEPRLASVPAAPDVFDDLSQREVEVLHLLAAGKSNREIAAALVISDHTVARHVQNIFAKLRVSSRAAATAFAFKHELI